VLALAIGLCWFLLAVAIVRLLAIAVDRCNTEQRELEAYYTRHPEKRT
jgi:hypothetical protein